MILRTPSSVFEIRNIFKEVLIDRSVSSNIRSSIMPVSSPVLRVMGVLWQLNRRQRMGPSALGAISETRWQKACCAGCTSNLSIESCKGDSFVRMGNESLSAHGNGHSTACAQQSCLSFRVVHGRASVVLKLRKGRNRFLASGCVEVEKAGIMSSSYS